MSETATSPPWIVGVPSVARVRAHAKAHPMRLPKGMKRPPFGLWIELDHPDWTTVPKIVGLRVSCGRVVGGDGIGLNREMRKERGVRYLPVTADGIPVGEARPLEEPPDLHTRMRTRLMKRAGR